MNSDQKSVERIQNRFKLVSLEDPINAFLYNMAIKHDGLSQFNDAFMSDMDLHAFNPSDYLNIKKNVSLLPLETLKDRLKLPSIPNVVLELQKALREDADSDKIAYIIQQDPKLTTAVLSVVNSALYSLPSQIEALPRAIKIIGSKQMSSLILGTQLMIMFEDSVPKEMPLTTFWKHSIACAMIAHELAALCSKDDIDKYFVAGLLHDLGRVVLFSQFPEVAKIALALQAQQNMSLHEAELWLFDVDHCTIGGIFFNEWGLPNSVKHSALYHHRPDYCLGKDVAEIIYVANQIAVAFGMGCSVLYKMNSGKQIWDKLSLDRGEVETVLEDIEGKILSMYSRLFQ